MDHNIGVVLHQKIFKITVIYLEPALIPDNTFLQCYVALSLVQSMPYFTKLYTSLIHVFAYNCVSYLFILELLSRICLLID